MRLSTTISPKTIKKIRTISNGLFKNSELETKLSVYVCVQSEAFASHKKCQVTAHLTCD